MRILLLCHSQSDPLCSNAPAQYAWRVTRRYAHRSKETNLALILVQVCGNIGPTCPPVGYIERRSGHASTIGASHDSLLEEWGCVCTRQTSMKVCCRKPSSFAVPTVISLMPTWPSPWAPGPTQEWC